MTDFNPWSGPSVGVKTGVQPVSFSSLPAGANAIGSVTLGAGSNAIGSVTSTPLDALTFSGTATSAAVVTYTTPGPSNGVIDTSGYGQISVQITGAGTSCTTTFQESNDNSTWVSVAAQNGANTAGGAATSTTSAGNFRIWPSARYFRLNVTVYGSGTVSATVCLRAFPAPPGNVGQGNGLSTATWGVALNGKSSGGLTASRIQSAASTNATSVKASAGQVYLVAAGNNGGSAAWLKLYNKASSPTVGTDTPVWSCYLPAGTAREVPITVGLAFGTGIAYAITGAAADTDTTAVAANQVTGVIGYV
jgi:hypothetical protein